MRRFVGRIEGEIAFLEDEEFLHLKNVLRLKVGDQIIVICDDDFEYLSTIVEIEKKHAVCEIYEKRVCEGIPKKDITLFQAVIKKDNFELVVLKTAELGVKKIVPFTSEFCNLKDRVENNLRLKKIIHSASKQSENSRFLKLETTLDFDEMTNCLSEYDIVLFANEREGENFDFSCFKSCNKIAVVVGCEGGFSSVEKSKLIEKKVFSVGLGKRILRSETASIVLCGMASVMGEN